MSDDVRKPIEFVVPDMPTISRCKARGCKADVVWVITAAGKRMPLSWHTVRIRPEDGKRVAQSHFADCVAADKFRRSARG